MVSAVEVEVYSNIALRPFMSCPVVCRMISAGITEASMSQQPGLMPAAVGSGGSDMDGVVVVLHERARLAGRLEPLHVPGHLGAGARALDVGEEPVGLVVLVNDFAALR